MRALGFEPSKGETRELVEAYAKGGEGHGVGVIVFNDFVKIIAEKMVCLLCRERHFHALEI
jgi:Ca2+-binding EF-hand superfamily protein